MKRFFLLCFAIVAASCHHSSNEENHGIEGPATTLSPSVRLRKLSLHLRGITPTVQEYDALDEADRSKTLESFFEKQTRDYLASAEHLGKMIDRLDDLFQFRTASGRPESRLLNPSISPHVIAGNETYNSAGFIFQSLAEKNLSWDLLLTGKQYSVANPGYITAFGRYSDLGFFNNIVPSLPPSKDGTLKSYSDPNKMTNPAIPPTVTLLPVNFPEKDPRVAGVLTTSRFFARYNTTILNKSRGRAAAVFRIFLCDNMRAVVDAKQEDDDALLDQVFPGGPEHPDGHPVHATAADEKKHGSETSCMACHYKLDPLGKTFVTSGSVLSHTAAPGALTYKREDGSLVNVSVDGIGELGKAITEQKEYAECQVLHFWQWYIQSDRLPSKERVAELAAAFNKVGRRTNDFIAYLVSQPEFIRLPNADTVTFSEARAILRNCNSCHAGVTSTSIPSLTDFPIGSASQHSQWVSRISIRLDLKHLGAAKTMPPKESAWQPSTTELKLLKAWVAGGAVDADGKRTIDEKTANDLVGER